MIGNLAWWLAGLVAGALVVTYWDELSDAVAGWLREHGLENGALMEAWIRLDSLATRIRARIFVRTRQHGRVQVQETTLTPEQVEELGLSSPLRRHGHVEASILEHIH